MSDPAAHVPLRHRIEYVGFRLGTAVATVLPERVALALGALIGWLAGSVLRIRRRTVEANLALALSDRSPSWRRRVARASYAHLGREAVFIFRMAGWSADRIAGRLNFSGLETLRDAVERNEGVVILTGHLGNWEVAGAGLAAVGIPLDVVGKGMANRRFEADLFEARAGLGMRVIEMSEAPKEVLRSLGDGRAIAMLSDQNAHRWGVFISFFGKPAATPRGAALFALRRSVPIFVGWAIRERGPGQRYRAEVVPLRYDPTGDLERDVPALLTEYHRLLEEGIRSAPEQYFWQHKRWKTRPSEEQPPHG